MGGQTTGAPGAAAEKVPSVVDDFTSAAPGLWDGIKHAASGFKKLMDENPTATKWISFGLGFLALASWGGSLVRGLLNNIVPGLADSGIMSGIVTCLILVGAFIGANKLSQALANSGAGTRANEQQAAGQQQQQNVAAFNARAQNTGAGATPTFSPLNGSQVNPSSPSGYQVAFANAGTYPPAGGYRPSGGRTYVEDNPGFPQYPKMHPQPHGH